MHKTGLLKFEQHMRIGYLQKDGAILNLNDRVYHYYGNIEELGSLYPLMRELKVSLHLLACAAAYKRTNH